MMGKSLKSFRSEAQYKHVLSYRSFLAATLQAAIEDAIEYYARDCVEKFVITPFVITPRE